MNISQKDLRRIIVEEYIAEEALDEDSVDDLLDWIKGGKKPEWAGDKKAGTPPSVPTASADDTQAMEQPLGAAGPADLVAIIGELVHGFRPDEVAEIFDAVFAQLTGQEAPPSDEPPETLYVKGAEGRPAAGFKLEELYTLIREVLEEDRTTVPQDV